MNSNTLKILYEDPSIIVCVKPHGIPTQSRNTGMQDMESLLKNHIATNSKNDSAAKHHPYLAVIHRLDQPVEGILVFAKTPAAARDLNQQLQNQGFGKYYLALVDGIPPQTEGTLEDYLVKDSRTNTSRICAPGAPGAKLAILKYNLEKGQGYFNWGRGFSKKTPSPSVLEVRLETGRHHQIRVQLAHIGCPIVGDSKYNPNCSSSTGWQELQLCAYKLTFRHPQDHHPMNFSLLPE